MLVSEGFHKLKWTTEILIKKWNPLETENCEIKNWTTKKCDNKFEMIFAYKK